MDLLADNEGSNEAKYIAVILDFLDSQADAYTTGYNQALKDVQEIRSIKPSRDVPTPNVRMVPRGHGI